MCSFGTENKIYGKRRSKSHFKIAANGHLGLPKIPKKANDDLEKVKIYYNQLAHIVKTNVKYRVCFPKVVGFLIPFLISDIRFKVIFKMASSHHFKLPKIPFRLKF